MRADDGQYAWKKKTIGEWQPHTKTIAKRHKINAKRHTKSTQRHTKLTQRHTQNQRKDTHKINANRHTKSSQRFAQNHRINTHYQKSYQRIWSSFPTSKRGHWGRGRKSACNQSSKLPPFLSVVTITADKMDSWYKEVDVARRRLWLMKIGWKREQSVCKVHLRGGDGQFRMTERIDIFLKVNASRDRFWTSSKAECSRTRFCYTLACYCHIFTGIIWRERKWKCKAENGKSLPSSLRTSR